MNKTWLLILVAGLSMTVLWKSCKKEDDPEPSGTDGFVGSFLCKENCNVNGASNYQITIKNASNPAEVNLFNFFNAGSSKYATGQVNGNNLEIPLQSYVGFSVSGYGTLNGNTVSLTYSIDDGTLIDTCSAILTRQ